MRTLLALIRRDLTVVLTYRAWLAMIQVSTITGPVVSLLVWQGALDLGAAPPVSRDFLVTYFVLVALVSMLTSSWSSWFIADSIRHGELSSWLVRPVSVHLNLLANNVSEKLVKLVLLVPMIVVVGFVVRSAFRLPTDPVRWLLFVVALLLATALTIGLDVLIGTLAFWFEDVSGLDRFRLLLSSVFSGGVVPLALFPQFLQPVLDVQPFRYMISFPLEVLLGTASPTGFVGALAWAAVFVGGAALTWRVGVTRYQGAGA